MSERVERVDEHDRVVGVVDRDDAVRNGWFHRVAATVCRDTRGRYLVYRRADGITRFPGHHDVCVGGAVAVGESYAAAAVRELREELGIDVPVRPVCVFLCRGELTSYWLAVYEAVFDGEVRADPREIAWHGWLTPEELTEAIASWPFVSDGQIVFRRYLDAGRPQDSPQ
ncbi:MAG: NUDIX domain-containing protein [Actinophytocola sp.]|uniref:NUDIX hydrolase n=1 Tax=Actinophytocola sp. TaxID=1872138 RepID=UPI003C770758